MVAGRTRRDGDATISLMFDDGRKRGGKLGGIHEVSSDDARVRYLLTVEEMGYFRPVRLNVNTRYGIICIVRNTPRHDRLDTCLQSGVADYQCLSPFSSTGGAAPRHEEVIGTGFITLLRPPCCAFASRRASPRPQPGIAPGCANRVQVYLDTACCWLPEIPYLLPMC